MMRNLSSAVGQLTRRPGLPAVIIAILAIGIGVTTGIFSLFHQLLLKPLPVPEPDELVNLAPDPIPVFSYPMFRDLEARQNVLTGLAAYDNIDSNLSYETRVRAGSAMAVSGQYFEVLGLQAALGRLIGPKDEPALAESRVAVLSHDYWQRDLGGDPSVVGRTLTLNGHVLTIVGIAPAGFSGTAFGAHPEVFVPLTLEYLLRNIPTDEALAEAENRSGFSLLVFGRLRAGIELEQAAAALDALHSGIVDEVEASLDPQFPIPDRTIALEPGGLGQRDEADPLESPLAILLGVAFVVLLVVCANAASLLIARGAGRANEMTIRAAMGAGRRQLVSQLLTEALVLAIVGAVLSVPIAFLTLAGVALFVPENLADVLIPKLSSAALLFTAIASLATVLLFGVAPAVQTSRTGVRLVASGPQSSAAHGATRFRSLLAAAQIAFSVVLLVVAGLLSQSLANIARVNLGMDVDSLLTFHIAPRRNGYDAQRTAASYAQVEETLAAQPGVTSVASVAIPLLTRSGLNRMVEVPAAASRSVDPQARVNYVSPRLFATTGVPLLAGRDFADTDDSSSPQVAIVNESFVRKFNLGNDAIGRRFRVLGDEGDREIVGVVADASHSGGGVKQPVSAQFYQPLSQWDPLLRLPQRVFYVRTSASPDALVRAIPRLVANVDANLPVSALRTMEQQFAGDIYEDRLVTALSASFAALAALLTALGLYGMLTYAVTQRTRELGLRLALGAAPARLRSLVLRHVGVMLIGGCTVGVLAAIGAVRVVEAILFGVSRYEPLPFVAAVLALGLVALAAGYLPARRASRIAPMSALRYE
jgi:predicted permease